MGTPPLPQNQPDWDVFYTLVQWKAKFLNGTQNPRLRGVKRRLLENENQLLECDHSISAGGLCFVCARQLALTTTTAASSPDEKRVPLRYIMDAFSLSEKEMLALRSINHQTNLEEKKKLSLVLDLDNTLLQSIKIQALKQEDLASFRDFDKENIYVLSDVRMLLKLRPFVLEFLSEVSKMFELHIYTMGSRHYANTIANLLDPDETHFDWRVISREDCTIQGQKSLDVVVGEESAVVIVDDRRSVWGKYEKNVLPIKPYHFWERGGRGQMPIGYTNDRDIELEFMLETLKRLHHSYYDTRTSVGETKRDVRVFMLASRKFYSQRSNSSNNYLTPPPVQAKGINEEGEDLPKKRRKSF